MKLIILLLFFTFIATGSIITTASISASNYMIRNTTNIFITLQLIHSIPANGKLLILFPDQLLPSSPIFCSISGVSSSSSSICQLSNHALAITNCFPSTSFLLGMEIFSIPTPNYSQTTDSFQIFTVYSSGSVIDSIIISLSLTFNPLQMVSAIMTPKQLIAGSFTN